MNDRAVHTYKLQKDSQSLMFAYSKGGHGPCQCHSPNPSTHLAILLMHKQICSRRSWHWILLKCIYEGFSLTRSDNAALAFLELLEEYDDPAADASEQGPEACLTFPLSSHVCRQYMQVFWS